MGAPISRPRAKSGIGWALLVVGLAACDSDPSPTAPDSPNGRWAGAIEIGVLPLSCAHSTFEERDVAVLLDLAVNGSSAQAILHDTHGNSCQATGSFEGVTLEVTFDDCGEIVVGKIVCSGSVGFLIAPVERIHARATWAGSRLEGYGFVGSDVGGQEAWFRLHR